MSEICRTRAAVLYVLYANDITFELLVGNVETKMMNKKM